LKKPLILFLLLIFVPIAASAARYFWLGDGRGNWQTADRSSAIAGCDFQPRRYDPGFRRPHREMAQHLRRPHLDRREGKGRDQLYSL
jgi:hypothetical protein